MNDFGSRNYLELMVPWLRVLPSWLRSSEVGTWYGTGESAHWSVQSNMNVCAALAVMAEDPDLEEFSPSMSREEIRATAAGLFRYAMRTHLTGDAAATDGKPWGHHWISVLGAERMTHGINALLPHLTDEDREHYRNFRISESDWLLKEYEVVADVDGRSGKNKPESNIWNGGFLMRTALDYPDLPQREEYLEKACSFLLNGISHPDDAASEKMFRGRPLRDWHVGYNFTENYSLDHHGYLNVGYMAICLSNVAMLHFNFRERGQTPPPELYHHAEDLWRVVKNFIFPDGRLLRIGGDTRARYTYCQSYAIPMWLLAADLFHDREAAQFERNFLEVMRKEQNDNGDGSFYSKRLDNIRETSYYYYCRLESDPALALSCGAYWRRKFQLVQPPEKPVIPSVEWSDDFHGASLIRTGNTVRSWVKGAHNCNTGVCVPQDRSDMAEWHYNLNGLVVGNEVIGHVHQGIRQTIPNGLLYRGQSEPWEIQPWGEGENPYAIAKQQTAVAAVPDGKTMLIAARCVMTKESTLRGVFGLNLEMPNDVVNGFVRHYAGKHFRTDLKMKLGEPELVDSGSAWLNIDNCLTVRLLSGGDSLKIYRSGKRDVAIMHKPLYSMFLDRIVSSADLSVRRRMPGEVLFDTVFLIAADVNAEQSPELTGKAESSGLTKKIEFTGMDGKTYRCRIVYTENAAELPELEFAPV